MKYSMYLLILSFTYCATTKSQDIILVPDKCYSKTIDDSRSPKPLDEIMKQVERSEIRCRELFGEDSCLVRLVVTGPTSWRAYCAPQSSLPKPIIEEVRQ